MSTNKEELVEVNGYGDKAANEEAADKFCTFYFTYIPYTIQENV